MRGSRALGVFAALLCLVATGPAHAAPLPPEADNVMFIEDPLPHLERLLTSEALRWALVSGPDARRAGGPVDLAEALRTVRGAADYIPRELALATPAAAMDGLDRVVRLLSLLVVFDAMSDAGADVARKERPALQKELLGALSGLELPRLIVWARFRGERVATELHRLAGGAAASLEGYGCALERDDAAFGVRCRLGELIDDDAAAAILVELGALAGPRDPRRAALVRALRAVTLEAWLERVGDGLRLTVGTRRAGAVPSAAWVADAPPVAGATVLTARWDMRPLKAGAARWKTLIDGWQRGPLAAAIRRKDTEDVLGSLRFLADSVLDAAGRGAMRLASDGATLRGEVRAAGARTVRPLAGTPLLALLPADAEAHWISGEVGAGEALRDTFLYLEDRLAMQSLKAQAGGRDAQAAMIEEITRTYYTSFAAARDILLHKLPALTPAPGAVVMWGGGGFDAAVIATARDPKATRRVVEELLREVARGAAQATKRTLPADARFLRDEDLGLGVPTHVVDTAWIRTVTGADLGARAEIVPHLFFVDGHVVLSSSTRASKRVLAARAGGPRLSLPPGATIASARGDRRVLVGAIDTIFGEGAGSFRFILRAAGAIVADAQLVEIAEGGERRTRFEVRFAPP